MSAKKQLTYAAKRIVDKVYNGCYDIVGKTCVSGIPPSQTPVDSSNKQDKYALNGECNGLIFGRKAQITASKEYNLANRNRISEARNTLFSDRFYMVPKFAQSARNRSADCCERESIEDQLFIKVGCPNPTSSNKVTVVGVGQVGMASAFSLLVKGISNEVALVDLAKDKLQGEMMDLQHGSTLLNNARIRASQDFAISACSKVIVITAGARQQEGESRLNLVQKNVDIMKVLIPKLLEHSPDAILLLVSNPVDIVTYAAWKISCLPNNRVIGSGTYLDSVRFRFMISEKLGIAPSSCHAWIIGEHGDSSVPVWSGVNIAGTRLKDLNKDLGSSKDPEKWGDLHKAVVDSAYDVIKLKGYTSWGIGLSAAHLVGEILNNSGTVNACSTLVQGMHCIKEEVFLSVPAILGRTGITSVVSQTLSKTERTSLQKSAKLMHEIQKDLKF